MSSRESLVENTSEDERELEKLKTELSDSAESEIIAKQVDEHFLEVLDKQIRSAPSSPRSGDTAFSLVKFRVASFENLVEMSAAERIVAPLRATRSAHKSWVTKRLKLLEDSKDDGSLDRASFNRLNENINSQIVEIEKLDTKIETAYILEQVSGEDIHKTGDSVEFIFKAHKEVDHYRAYLDELEKQDDPVIMKGNDQSEVSMQNLIDALGKIQPAAQSNFLKIPIKCPDFDGNSKDKFMFKHWLAQVDTIIEAQNNWTGKHKLMLLQTHVKGLAREFISHLELTNENYTVARNLLMKEYLDIRQIKDEYFKQILEKQPGFDVEYLKTRQYLAEINNKLFDLKEHYGADLISEGTGGYQLISHVVFSKLSNELQKALILETKTCYPSFKEIYDNVNDVITTITRTRRKKVEVKTDSSSNWKPNKSSLKDSNSPTLNFNTSAAVDSNFNKKKHHISCIVGFVMLMVTLTYSVPHL